MGRHSLDLLREYLIHCHLYYSMAESVISDHEFDALCREIADTWDSLESPYKQFVYDLEKGNIEGIKGSELGKICPPEIQRLASLRLKDYTAEQDLLKSLI